MRKVFDVRPSLLSLAFPKFLFWVGAVSLGFFDDIYVPRQYLPSPSTFDSKERAYFWVIDFQNTENSQEPPTTHMLLDTPLVDRMYIDVGELVRIRVEADDFFDFEPGPPKGGAEASADAGTRRAPYTVLLLSRTLHEQIFANISFPPPEKAFVTIAKEHLKKHGLDPSQGSVLPDTSFTLPRLQGANLAEHFHSIGRVASEPWLSLAKNLSTASFPPRPEHVNVQSGWTKYTYLPDGSSYWELVPHPVQADGTPEQCLVFDVETLPKYHPYAIMATAGTPTAWYTWISPWLLGESPEEQHLIPLGDSSVPKIIVGHNVSYDRARVAEEYNLTMSKNRFIDTMSLHVAVKGISSHQRPAWNKYKKAKEVAQEQRDEAVAAVADMLLEVEDKLATETDEVHRTQLVGRRTNLSRQLAVDVAGDEEEETEKRWEELTSANSLRDVAKLHCGIEVDKEIRSDFMTCSREDILRGINDYLAYNIGDVSVTHSVYKAAFPEFMARCPHPVSFAGILTMGSSILPVNNEWENYLEQAERVFQEMANGVKENLKAVAEKACAMMAPDGTGGGWEDDPWLSQLDWSPKAAGTSRGSPQWFLDVSEDPCSSKVYERILPNLLELSFEGHPMAYNSKEKWHYLVDGEIHRLQSANGRKIGSILSKKHALPLLQNGQMTSRDLSLAIRLAQGGKEKPTQDILDLAKRVLDQYPDSAPSGHPFLDQLDWKNPQIVQAKRTAAKAPKPKGPLWPKWYWEATKPKKDTPPGTLDITARSRLAPLLLRLSWLGWPLVHSREHGWTFRVPGSAEFTTRASPLKFFDPEDQALADMALHGGFLFYKMPHKDGESANVGSPLSKTFMKFAQDGTLSSPGDEAKEALDLNAQCSYWISARDRIMNQMVVWDRSKQFGFPDVSSEGTPQKWGLILPQVITMGTVTRRAIEKTWLTASNAKKNRVGSELKAMVRAPPGYAIVGADVDSEELWISSCMGDAQFGLHGATAIGWMTLEGTKSAGTDLHSKTAGILGISRDQAKAQQLAENLYASTKGRNTHRNDLFDHKFWFGGTESFVFNKLEDIALSDRPQTPALGCGVTYALSKEYLPPGFGTDYMTSRINWVVPIIWARYLISVHDELRYLVKEEDKYRAALALQVANVWTRSMFAYRLGMDDLPQGVAFFSAVDVDHVLRKEVDMPCVTPSQPTPNPSMAESLDISKTLEYTHGGSLWADVTMSRQDNLTHRAKGIHYLQAQATSDFNEVKQMAQLATGKKYEGDIGGPKKWMKKSFQSAK
ncbi:hypothetical protein DL96DRAFT_1668176 [Flagelloscypha sp. PMI_526]|nr:hypothetical protein DL96DRAFT_1668176 [Flagelloscypha sp. PMI_526]